MNFKIEDLSINPKLLESSGYRKYTDNLKNKDSYIASWQKAVHNEHGKAYFVNFSFYDNSLFLQQVNNKSNPYSWETDLQFNSLEDDMTINIKIFATNKNLEEIEKICDRMFKKMQFRNYEYYADTDEENHKADIKKEEISENAFNLNKELSSKTNSQIKKRKKI